MKFDLFFYTFETQQYTTVDGGICILCIYYTITAMRRENISCTYDYVDGIGTTPFRTIFLRLVYCNIICERRHSKATAGTI